MIVTFERSQAEAPNIYSFFFRPAKPMHYTAGQFIELTLPQEQMDNRGEKRNFTLSSSPNDELLSITTRITSDSSTFKQTLKSLAKGAELHMAEPMGDFVLPKDTTIPLLFVAVGMGITPFHSILRWLHQEDESRDISLIHAVSTEDDIVFQETFRDAGIHATIIVKNPTSAWGGERGELTATHILKIAEPSPDSLLYIAGTEAVVEALEKDLQALEFPRSRLVTDFFHGYESA